jgi:hypothetical protein
MPSSHFFVRDVPLPSAYTATNVTPAACKVRMSLLVAFRDETLIVYNWRSLQGRWSGMRRAIA